MWQEEINIKLGQRDNVYTASTKIIQTYQSGLFTHKTVVEQMNQKLVGEKKELQNTRDQLMKTQSELSTSYEQSSKHARALFDSLEKSKLMEEKVHEYKMKIDELEINEEGYKAKINRLETELDAKSKGFDKLKEEYILLQRAMLDLEKQMNEIKRENYIVHKDNDKLVRETQQLEKQLSQTVEFVNNINDEFEIARNKLRDYEQAAQLKALKRKRTSSNPNPNGNGESPKKEPSSPSTGNVILDSIIASPTSLLDGTFFVGGTYEKPPSEKYHVLEKAHPESIIQLSYNYFGNLVAACSSDKSISLWNTLNGTKQRTLSGPTKSVRCVKFSADGQYLMAGSADNAAYLWQHRSSKLIHKFIGHQDKITGGEYNDTYLITSSYDRTLRQWDVVRGSCIKTTKSCGSRFNDICKTSLGLFITANHDRSIRLFDVRSMELVNKIDCHDDIVTSVCCAADCSSILTCSKDNKIKIVDIGKMEVVKTFSHPDFVARSDTCRASFMCSDRFIAAGSSSGSVLVWNVESQKLVGTTPRISNVGQLNCFDGASSGHQMVFGTTDGSIVMWDQ